MTEKKNNPGPPWMLSPRTQKRNKDTEKFDDCVRGKYIRVSNKFKWQKLYSRQVYYSKPCKKYTIFINDDGKSCTILFNGEKIGVTPDLKTAKNFCDCFETIFQFFSKKVLDKRFNVCYTDSQHNEEGEKENGEINSTSNSGA